MGGLRCVLHPGESTHLLGSCSPALACPSPRPLPSRVCNCDCLPIIPIEYGRCEACAAGHVHVHDDEATSMLDSRDSMDSVRSGAGLMLA